MTKSAKEAPPRLARTATLVVLALLAGACASMPPVLTAAMVGFGRDVILSAAQNFAPQYANSTGGVLLALAETATGQPFSQLPSGELVQVGNGHYGINDSGYGNSSYGDPGHGDSSYGDSSYGNPGHGDSGYGDSGYGDQGYGDYQQDSGYGDYSQQGHAEQPIHPDYQGYPGSQPAGPSYGADPYGAAPQPYAVAAAPKLKLDVAILAQRQASYGAPGLQPVADGDVLFGAGSANQTGDRIKFFFRSNCDCYVYIVGIDSTAWVTPIYPRSMGNFAPVRAGQDYLIPEERLWWALDEHKGVETIYFVLSRSRIANLEARLLGLPTQRPRVETGFRPVTVAALLPSRGLVLVEDSAPIQVPTAYGGGQPLSPLGFTTEGTEDQLVVSRWFRHE